MARRVRRFLPYPYAPSGVALQLHACTLETKASETGETSGANSMRLVWLASQVKETQSSRESLSGGFILV